MNFDPTWESFHSTFSMAIQAAAIGLYVVLSGFYSSDGIWQHQEFDEAKLDRAKEVMDLFYHPPQG